MKEWLFLFVVVLNSGSVQAQAPARETGALQKAPTVQTPAEPSKAGSQAPKRNAEKEAEIRSLVEMTGGKQLTAQLLQASLEQMRAFLAASLPPGEKSKTFTDLFIQKFQERFSLDALLDRLVPVYDRYLTAEDVKGLLKFYGSPLGQRMLKVQPQIGRETQTIGFEMTKTVSNQVLNELKAEYPEFLRTEKP